MCHNSSVNCPSKTFWHHSRAKNIVIKYKFIRDHVLKRDIEISFISVDFHLADIFTKPL